MSFTRSSTLFGTLVRLDDSGSGPPWPVEAYNAQTHAWEALGVSGLEKLGDITVPAGGQPTITFDPIAPGYSALRLQLVAAADSGTSYLPLLASFNGDTDPSHYETHSWYTDSTGATGQNTFASPTMGGEIGALTTPGAIKPTVPAALIAELPGYDSTAFAKMVHIDQGLSLDYAAYAQVLMKLMWNSLSPITSIVLQPLAGNFVAGSRAVLHGIR